MSERGFESSFFARLSPIVEKIDPDDPKTYPRSNAEISRCINAIDSLGKTPEEFIVKTFELRRKQLKAVMEVATGAAVKSDAHLFTKLREQRNRLHRIRQGKVAEVNIPVTVAFCKAVPKHVPTITH